MPEISCKYVKHTGLRQSLRIYWGDNLPESHGKYTFHNAMKDIEDLIGATWDNREDIAIHNANDDEYKKYRGKWPTKCDHCDAVPPPVGTPNVNYQIFYESLYDDPPRLLQPGDIWDVPWMHNAPDSYAVKLPNGDTWFTYQIASNCSHGDEGKKHHHKCWTVNGTPPNLDVSPSIWDNIGSKNDWHGHLKNGKLVW